MQDFYKRYGGRANVREVRAVQGRLNTKLGVLKKQLRVARRDGDEVRSRELMSEVVREYRQSAVDLAEALQAAGVEVDG
jgi:hypothetical protein